MIRGGARVQLAVTLAAVALASACTQSSQGEVRHLCGALINQPADEEGGSLPWYLDLTKHPHSSEQVPVLPPPQAGNASQWVRVSASCARGATVSVVPEGRLRIVDVVRAGDGSDVAVLIDGQRAGTATLTATAGGAVVGVLTANAFDATTGP